MATHYQQDITAPSTFPATPNVVLPARFKNISVILMTSDPTKVAYLMFSDPAADGAPNPVRLVAGTRSEAQLFTEQDTLGLYIKGDNSPPVQIVCEGERRG